MEFLRVYFLNFFIWYYRIFAKDIFNNIFLQTFKDHLQARGVIVMAENFYEPLYQDDSPLGKSLGMIIRFWWIGTGTILSILFVIPNFIVAILVLIFPFLFLLSLLAILFNTK